MTRRAAFWAGLAVILAVSGGTLLGVLWNRTGTPDAVLELEERELILLPAERENSGRAMAFVIEGERQWFSASPPWLDRAKLAALGFDTSVDAEADDAEQHYRAQPRRQVFVALELGGDAFRKYLAEWEERLRKEAAGTEGTPPTPERLAEIERELATAPESASRLALIDADRDREALRARHPDRSKVAILRAVARIRWDRPIRRPSPSRRACTPCSKHCRWRSRARCCSTPNGSRCWAVPRATASASPSAARWSPGSSRSSR